MNRTSNGPSEMVCNARMVLYITNDRLQLDLSIQLLELGLTWVISGFKLRLVRLR